MRPAVPDPPELFAELWPPFAGGEYGWDVGANCGQSYAIMRMLFRRVTCFEPTPAACDYIRENGGQDVDLHEIALSDHDGELELAFPAKEQKETGQLVTIGVKGMEWEPEDWDAVEKVTVPCRTADSLAAEFGVPDFMKIDTEGHEDKVLAGAAGLVAAGKTDFLVEFHSPENHEWCASVLQAYGYTTKVVRHPYYPEGGAMWRQHGWILAFAPGRKRDD